MKKFGNPFDLLRQNQGALGAAPGVDVRGITDTINRALASAGLTSQSGVARNVTETIERAFASAGLRPAASPPGSSSVLEGVARDVTAGETSVDGDAGSVPALLPPAGAGEFATRSFASEAGSRAYKLYVPTSYALVSEERVPLVVMLHGCTQDPDDFAAGTRMNALADQHGFLVAYPAQPAQANGAKCWNWFRAQDQARDAGEPALIAGITREVAAGYRIDERRIFVAGLSAGAAMAVVLGATYPELYAAVGVHSGLPYAAAHDVPSAFAAMQAGAQGGRPRSKGAPNTGLSAPVVPTIIFHGDQDATVNAANADAIAAQARAGLPDASVLRATVTQGIASGGRTYTRTVLADGANPAVVEQWTLHGSGHAWSGGDASGTFTDVNGPDASAEMIRFFHSQRRAGNG